MKLDVLTGFEELKICTHYKIDGEVTDQYPTQLEDLAKVEPVYISLPGWTEDITGCRDFDALPENAKKYVAALQAQCYNLPYLMVSVGPDRAETIITR